MNLTSIHEEAGSIPGLAHWISELWCRSQMQLGYGVAVTVTQASSYSSDSTPSLGSSICQGCGPNKQKKKKKNTKDRGDITDATEIKGIRGDYYK